MDRARPLLGALALLRAPGELDGEALARAATAAAREGLDDARWWSALTLRAQELASSLALHDAAVLLNAAARARRLEAGLVRALLPRLTSQLVYLTSAHLAMLCSAVAKAEVHDQDFLLRLTRELRARLLEFHSAMEITMILNSASKLRITDQQLYSRFAAHVQNRMRDELFHVRDISVIVGALARVGCAEPAVIARFAEFSLSTLPEATVPELARLMEACMRASCVVDDFYTACVSNCQAQMMDMDPGSISAAAFAFGQCFDAADVQHLPYLRRIFSHIRLASVRSLPLFLPRELVSVLRTYARWQVPFEDAQLRKFADRMTMTRDRFNIEASVSALYSLAVLMQRAAVRCAGPKAATWEASGEAANALLGPVWQTVRRGHLDLPSVLRAVDASLTLLPGDPSPLAAVAACLVRRRPELDATTAGALLERLSQLSSYDEDVLLVLRDAAQSLRSEGCLPDGRRAASETT